MRMGELYGSDCCSCERFPARVPRPADPGLANLRSRLGRNGCCSTPFAADDLWIAAPWLHYGNTLGLPTSYGLQMSDVTRILSAIEQGDPHAAEQLLPLVYDELRKLAAQKLSQEKPGQTLQATALVHDAYIRLVDVEKAQQWNSRGHFFAAAAEAMRRILVERARRKGRIRHGGGLRRADLLDAEVAAPSDDEQVLLLDEALARLAAVRPQAAEVVKLRFFAGLTLEEIAPLLALSPRTTRRLWVFARAWLRRDIERSNGPVS
jgi:RNA polymerase sigma factor (TIGR02999 family)